jgi:hypothetical protein
MVGMFIEWSSKKLMCFFRWLEIHKETRGPKVTKRVPSVFVYKAFIFQPILIKCIALWDRKSTRSELPANNLRRISTMYVRGYLQGSENGRVVTIDYSISLCYTRNIVQLNSFYIKLDSKHFFLKKNWKI